MDERLNESRKPVDGMSDRILWVKGKAGLGNRLLVVLEALVYAELTDRTLVIDWRDRAYSDAGENAFPCLFESPATLDPSLLDGEADVVPQPWSRALPMSVDELIERHYPNQEDVDQVARVAARFTIDPWRIDDRAKIAVRWAWTHELFKLRPHFRGKAARFRVMNDAAILRTMAHQHLRPSRAVMNLVDPFAARHFSVPTIGLHARFTDRQTPFQKYGPHVDAFLQAFPNGNIFVATDSPMVEEWFQKRYARVLVTEKWRPSDGAPIHRNRQARDRMQSSIEAVADMVLLSKCNSLLYNSRSTFGVVADLLSRTPWTNLDTATATPKDLAKDAFRLAQRGVPPLRRWVW